MSERLSPEREAQARSMAHWKEVRELLAELDAVRAENKELRAALGWIEAANESPESYDDGLRDGSVSFGSEMAKRSWLTISILLQLNMTPAAQDFNKILRDIK